MVLSVAFVCPYLFLIAPSSGASVRLCFAIVAFPGYRLLYLLHPLQYLYIKIVCRSCQLPVISFGKPVSVVIQDSEHMVASEENAGQKFVVAIDFMTILHG